MPSHRVAPARMQPLRGTDVTFTAAVRVADLAVQRLGSLHYPQLRSVRCDYHEGVLTLRGVVSSFHLKQVAQVALVNLNGVEVIANRLEVRYRR